MAIISAIAAVAAAVVLIMIFFTGSANSNANNSNGNATPGKESRNEQAGDAFDYNDIASVVAGIPQKEAFDAMYVLIEGFWVTDDGFFVRFVYIDSMPAIEIGLFDSGFSTGGKIVDGCAVDTLEAVLTIYVPATEPNMLDDGRPEGTESICLDLSDLIQNTTIRIKADVIGSGDWYTFEFGGSTIEQAYENWKN